MSTQNKTKRDTGVSQGHLNPEESRIKHINFSASTTDFYTEWTTAKSSIQDLKAEKQEKSLESSVRKVYQSHTMTSRNKQAHRIHGDMYATTTYNEIYNMAELFNYP